MTSAAVAVFLTELRRGHRLAASFFAVVSAVFIYTIVVTIKDRPEGLWIALMFVAAILVVSISSRVSRSTELRVPRVVFDESATALLAGASHEGEPLRFIANRLDDGDDLEYREKSYDVRLDNHLLHTDDVVFLEVDITDASDFMAAVPVTAVTVGPHRILRATGTSVPNVLAAVLLAVRNRHTDPPHVYFEWSEQPPAQNALRFILAGEGDIPAHPRGAAPRRARRRPSPPGPRRRLRHTSPPRDENPSSVCRVVPLACDPARVLLAKRLTTKPQMADRLTVGPP